MSRDTFKSILNSEHYSQRNEGFSNLYKQFIYIVCQPQNDPAAYSKISDELTKLRNMVNTENILP